MMRRGREAVGGSHFAIASGRGRRDKILSGVVARTTVQTNGAGHCSLLNGVGWNLRSAAGNGQHGHDLDRIAGEDGEVGMPFEQFCCGLVRFLRAR